MTVVGDLSSAGGAARCCGNAWLQCFSPTRLQRRSLKAKPSGDGPRSSTRHPLCNEKLAGAFLDNFSFDRYEETLLVGELETMNVAGRDAFITRANLATDKPTGLHYRTMA